MGWCRVWIAKIAIGWFAASAWLRRNGTLGQFKMIGATKIVNAFGDSGAILIVDETGNIKNVTLC
ncbi:hypothetical protein DIJ64_01750 [Mycobacterium leprae]|uniref:Uncharacterized protein n=1 Tax=Mycobacterium leprae TaxID=1769 RepID=A0AAD0P4G2_MYCLR|nr:hypothetical protein DIJ64_01750 [Mycobacterium leprae]